MLIGKLPSTLRTHVLMNPAATQDYQALRNLIEAYILTGRRWEVDGPAFVGKAKDTGGVVPMENDALKGKKGKTKGKWFDKGKSKGGGKWKNKSKKVKDNPAPEAEGKEGGAGKGRWGRSQP